MPQVSSEELRRFLLKRGFRVLHQRGSHLLLIGPKGEQVVIPMHGGRDLGRGMAVKVLKDAGYTPDDFIRLR